MGFVYKSNVPHGITFGERHTWRDWRLVPTSRPVFLPPEVKTTEIDIPGSDGSLDLTESLTGDVKYKNRIGSIEFQVENRNNWADVYSEIMNYLHGQQMKAILDDDPNFYYLGRFSINNWKSDKFHSLITIDYNVGPYKRETVSTAEDWVWDTFNFETGIIKDYRNIVIDNDNYTDIRVIGTRMKVIPTFTATSTDGNGLEAYHRGLSVHLELPDGITKSPTFMILDGVNVIGIKGHGTVTIDYRGGSL